MGAFLLNEEMAILRTMKMGIGIEEGVYDDLDKVNGKCY